MRFSFRRIATVLGVAALIFCCSCEKHHVGELPEAQRERVDLASAPDENLDMVKERLTSPAPSIKPTPAEFFPESSPR
jgi:hypothetical protein